MDDLSFQDLLQYRKDLEWIKKVNKWHLWKDRRVLKEVEKILKTKYPEAKVYTRQFDRVSTSIELLAEYEMGDVSEELDKILKEEEDTEEQNLLRKTLKYYADEMMREHWYIPPHIFLLDNSWSLEWAGIRYLIRFLHRILPLYEEAGIPTEVLGFTTRNWKWGESRQEWLKAEKPLYPWRLNDLQHTVFKSFGESVIEVKEWFKILLAWENRRKKLGTPRYLKENIDGEALLWAMERIETRNEPKKLVIQISDWKPIDDSTLSVIQYKWKKFNDFKENILNDHLEWVLNYVQNNKRDELAVHLINISDYRDKDKKDLPYTSETKISDYYYVSKSYLEGVLGNIYPEFLRWVDFENRMSRINEWKQTHLWIYSYTYRKANSKDLKNSTMASWQSFVPVIAKVNTSESVINVLEEWVARRNDAPIWLEKRLVHIGITLIMNSDTRKEIVNKLKGKEPIQVGEYQYVLEDSGNVVFLSAIYPDRSKSDAGAMIDLETWAIIKLAEGISAEQIDEILMNLANWEE